MNKNIILVIILSFTLNINITHATNDVGSGFTYQGELTDNDSPANGNYEIRLHLFQTLIGAGATDFALTFAPVTVTNGLFTIDDVDFGDAAYASNNQFYIEVAVKKAGAASFDILTPRQRLQAVPYAVQAEFLAANGASNGDVLQFNGGDWVPASINNISPWIVNVSSSTLTTPGKVGIGTPGPTDRLHINSSVGENAFRVQVDGSTKFRVRDNGGVAVGLNVSTVPDDGLYVHGDVKQRESASGMVKYMIRANCDATPTIMQSYNGTNVTGDITITQSGTGFCTILVPSNNISGNYLSVSSRTSRKLATCAPLLGGMLCRVRNDNGVNVNGDFDVLVF